MDSNKTYSVQEVAERYDVSITTINRWIKDGAFPGSKKKNPMKLSSPFVIPQSAIDYFDKLRDDAASS